MKKRFLSLGLAAIMAAFAGVIIFLPKAAQLFVG